MSIRKRDSILGYRGTISILGDERTSAVLRPLLNQATSRQIMAEGTPPNSPEELLQAVIRAAPPDGPWVFIVDFAIWDREEEYLVGPPEIEANRAKYLQVKGWIEALDLIKDYQVEINLKDLLPVQIVPIHTGRDGTAEIINRIQRSVVLASEQRRNPAT